MSWFDLKRWPAVRRVTSWSGALALLFFTTYAGYAIGPVRVMTDPLTAAAAQCLATLVIAYLFWTGTLQLL